MSPVLYIDSWYRQLRDSPVRMAKAFAEGMEMHALSETRKELLTVLKRKPRPAGSFPPIPLPKP